jgi:hypothetical protein
MATDMSGTWPRGVHLTIAYGGACVGFPADTTTTMLLPKDMMDTPDNSSSSSRPDNSHTSSQPYTMRIAADAVAGKHPTPNDALGRGFMVFGADNDVRFSLLPNDPGDAPESSPVDSLKNPAHPPSSDMYIYEIPEDPNPIKEIMPSSSSRRQYLSSSHAELCLVFPSIQGELLSSTGPEFVVMSKPLKPSAIGAHVQTCRGSGTILTYL